MRGPFLNRRPPLYHNTKEFYKYFKEQKKLLFISALKCLFKKFNLFLFCVFLAEFPQFALSLFTYFSFSDFIYKRYMFYYIPCSHQSQYESTHLFRGSCSRCHQWGVEWIPNISQNQTDKQQLTSGTKKPDENDEVS